MNQLTKEGIIKKNDYESLTHKMEVSISHRDHVNETKADNLREEQVMK